MTIWSSWERSRHASCQSSWRKRVAKIETLNVNDQVPQRDLRLSSCAMNSGILTTDGSVVAFTKWVDNGSNLSKRRIVRRNVGGLVTRVVCPSPLRSSRSSLP